MYAQFRNYEIILASNSPRRKELLELTDLPFKTLVFPDVSEVFSKSESPENVAKWLAKAKMQIYQEIWSQPNKIVITADTIVVVDNIILNKSSSSEEAIEMLNLLNGKRHKVITGVGIKSAERESFFDDTTIVEFKNLSQKEIEYYVDKYKPFDKAGSYGIQEWIGLVGIRKIEGSYFNVMGLPVDLAIDELMKF